MQSSATIAGILTLDHRIPTSDLWSRRSGPRVSHSYLWRSVWRAQNSEVAEL